MKRTLGNGARLTALLALLCGGLLHAQDKQLELVVVRTAFGDMTIYLYDDTPKHKANFLKLAREGYYDSTAFYRISEDEVLYGGDANTKDSDPANDGLADPGYKIPAERSAQHFHKRGAVAADMLPPHLNPDGESHGSHFFVVFGNRWSDEDVDTFEMQEQNLQKQIFGQRDYLTRPETRWVHDLKWSEMAEKHPDSIRWYSMKLQEGLNDAFLKTNSLFKFTPEARKAYTNVGGAPKRDNHHTAFGEVIGGLDVLDKIMAADTVVIEGTPDKKPKTPVLMQVDVVKLDRAALKERFNFTPPAAQK